MALDVRVEALQDELVGLGEAAAEDQVAGHGSVVTMLTMAPNPSAPWDEDRMQDAALAPAVFCSRGKTGKCVFGGGGGRRWRWSLTIRERRQQRSLIAGKGQGGR